MSNSIIIYSRDGCAYCDKIKAILDQREIPYTLNELDVTFTRDEFYSEFGVGTTFPQVLYNDENIGGCTEAVQYLHENNII